MTLRDYLKAHGLTVEEFAQQNALGIHAVGKLVRGDRYPRMELAQLIRAATGFAVGADDMLHTAIERQGIALCGNCGRPVETHEDLLHADSDAPDRSAAHCLCGAAK